MALIGPPWPSQNAPQAEAEERELWVWLLLRAQGQTGRRRVNAGEYVRGEMRQECDCRFARGSALQRGGSEQHEYDGDRVMADRLRGAAL